MKVGYVRVSTPEQNEHMQIDALKRAGCEKTFTDKASGVKFDRAGLNEMLSFMREGDTLVVWKLDRLGRSLIDLINIIQDLEKRGIDFISTTQSIDTTTSVGRLFFYMTAAFAEYERDLIRERTHAGLAAARARGRIGGRPKKLITPTRIAMLVRMYQDDVPLAEICGMFHISKPTLYRYVREAQEKV